MAALDNSGLPRREEDAVRDLMAGDPALESELELIVGAVSDSRRHAFWRAFVDGGGLSDRPAGAVLEALIQAARPGPD